MAPSDDLAEPVKDIILEAVPKLCVSRPETLLSLACTSKWFAAKLGAPMADP